MATVIVEEHGAAGACAAGETTTIRILTTLLKPDIGIVTIAGHDVLREPNKMRTEIGLAGESDMTDEYLSGVEPERQCGHDNADERELKWERSS